MGAQLGNLEWPHLPGTLRYGWKGLWRWSVSLCGSSVKGTWKEGSLPVDPEGYVQKALETGISFHRGPVRGTWRRARLPETLRDGWRGLCGCSVCLWRGSVEGALGGGSSFTGDPGRHVKKISRYGPFISMGDHFHPRETWYVGGGASYTEDEWRRTLVVGHRSARDSMKGTLRVSSFTGEPERWGFLETCKMPCKGVSLFIGALLGNLEGVSLPGLLREKKSISGLLSWTRMPLRF